MSNNDDVLEVMESLIVLRRALRTGITGNSGEPRLPSAQAQALLHVAQSGVVTMGELASQLGVSLPTATDLVDRLVESGRLSRESIPGDRRKVMVQLTPSAQEITDGALADRRAKVASVLDELSPRERSGFIRGLKMLSQTLSTGVGFWIADSAPLMAEQVVLISPIV